MLCVIYISLLGILNLALCQINSDESLIKTLAVNHVNIIANHDELSTEYDKNDSSSAADDDDLKLNGPSNIDDYGSEDREPLKFDKKDSMDEVSSKDYDDYQLQQMKGLSKDNDEDQQKIKASSIDNAEDEERVKDSLKRYISELMAGSTADLFGTNPHYKVDDKYKNLGRRFVPQYPYSEISPKDDDQLQPVKASPEFVLEVAKKSALLEASKPPNPTDDLIRKEILRTGDYWNDVWIEDVNPKSVLRSDRKRKTLENVTLKIMPDSELYGLIFKLKEISPRILYVVNENTNIDNF